MPIDPEDVHLLLPWEATAIIVTFVFGLPLAIAAFVLLFLSHSYDSRPIGLFCTALALPFFIWSTFAIRSRIKKGRAVGEPSGALIKPIMISFGGLAATTLLVLFFRFFASSFHTVYILPGGLFIGSLAIFGRAMSPPQPLRPPPSTRRKAPRY